MQTINLFGSTNKSLSANINEQENENCYLVQNYNGRNTVALVGAMGSSEFASGVAGVARGAYPQQIGSYAYFVVGLALWRVDSAGSAINVGTIPGGERVSIVFDGTSLIVFNGTTTGYYYNTESLSFSTVTLPAKAFIGTTLDTYVIFSSEGQQWYISNVGDSGSWDVLDTASANKTPDDLLAVWEDHSELILFGERTIEPWFNSADVDFAFSQNTAGIVERGTAARHSIVKEDNTLFFLGDDFIVYRLQGYQAVRVSNNGIETILSDIHRANPGVLSSAYAISYVEHGSKFYQLTIPNEKTLVFNIATNEWHTLKHWDFETHHAQAYCFAFGKHLIGTNLGGIFELSRDYYSDGVRPLLRKRRTQIIASNDQRLHWRKLKFIMEFGTTGLLTGQGSDPKLMLRWSDNFGRTFGNERHLRLGQTGEFNAKAIKRSCGSSRARVFEYGVSDPVPFIMVEAIAEIN